MEALKVFLIGIGSTIPIVLFANYKYPHKGYGYENCLISGFIGLTTGFIISEYLL